MPRILEMKMVNDELWVRIPSKKDWNNKDGGPVRLVDDVEINQIRMEVFQELQTILIAKVDTLRKEIYGGNQ